MELERGSWKGSTIGNIYGHTGHPYFSPLGMNMGPFRDAV